LIDKVWSPKNLAGSLQKVVAKGGRAGIDNQSARAVYEHQEQTIQKLEQELRTGQYQPQAVKRVWIPKAGSQEKRPLGVDRIVQGAKEQTSRTIFCPSTISKVFADCCKAARKFSVEPCRHSLLFLFS